MTDTFASFWEQERDRLFRVLAVGLDDADLASEAVDEAMARALQRWSRIGHLDDPAGWVLRVARNWATSRIRKWRRRPTLPAEDLDRPVHDDPVDVDLLTALRELPEKHRTVLALRFHLDWQVDRIAEVLEVPTGTVKSRINRALSALGDREEVSR